MAAAPPFGYKRSAALGYVPSAVLALLPLLHGASGLRLLQVGAHDHHPGGHDPAPRLIQAGWEALLVEAQAHNVELLRQKYAGNSRVTVLHAAVCRNSSQQSVIFYSLDTSNRSHGSNHSDIRCLPLAMQTAVASLNPHHTVGFQRYRSSTPTKCAACSKLIGRPLPDDCSSRVFRDNLLALETPCVSVAAAIPSGWGGVDSLIVDIEGQDDAVIHQYFSATPKLALPSSVTYEHAYLGKRHGAVMATLRAAGMKLKRKDSMNSEWVPTGPHASQKRALATG